MCIGSFAAAKLRAAPNRYIMMLFHADVDQRILLDSPGVGRGGFLSIQPRKAHETLSFADVLTPPPMDI